MGNVIFEVAVGLGLIAGILVAAEVGFALGRRRQVEPDAQSRLGTLQGAKLGLLALLLGFAFSGATSRFIERQNLIADEANAIGTLYLRADLLGEAEGEALRVAVRGYAEDCVREFEMPGDSGARERVMAGQRAVWSAAVRGVRARPEATVMVVPAANEVLDLHATRMSKADQHLPVPVLVLLIACALLSMGTIGFGHGVERRRRTGVTGMLAVLMATALWITIDLDHPRQGMIQLSEKPLVAARGAMR